MAWTRSFGIMLIYIQHKEEFEAQLPTWAGAQVLVLPLCSSLRV